MRNPPWCYFGYPCACLQPTKKISFAQVSPDGKQVLQKVEVVGRYPDDVRRMVDVQLTKEEDDCWRVDAMTLGPVAEQRK